MRNDAFSMAQPVSTPVVINRVLRNTYMLLSLTLLFSAATAGYAMKINAQPVGLMMTLIGFYGLFFLTNALRNSAWGIASTFALTGFMGYTLGPILNYYIQALPNGGQIVMLAMGMTGVVFMGMSGLALVSKRDFSFLGKFLMIGILVAFVAGIANVFLGIPALGLAVSAMFTLLMAGMILFQTQQIVQGGETNYIRATVGLYVSIYNLFLSLLHILGFAMGDD